MSAPVTLTDVQGRRVFGFDRATDPYSVLHRIAWAWPEGHKLCDMVGCPGLDGGYCCDCHAIGHAALRAARRTMQP